MLARTNGRVVRYGIHLFRPMGRTARGLSIVRPAEGVSIIGMTILPHQVGVQQVQKM